MTNDYLSYMSTWVNNTAAPLTDADAGNGLKIYGSAVWNHFVAARHGVGSILAAWQASTQVNGGPFAPATLTLVATLPAGLKGAIALVGGLGARPRAKQLQGRSSV